MQIRGEDAGVIDEQKRLSSDEGSVEEDSEPDEEAERPGPPEVLAQTEDVDVQDNSFDSPSSFYTSILSN